KRLRSRCHYDDLPTDTLDHAIGRLKRANSGRTVVLVIDIDAVDEANPANHGELCRLIRLWLDGGDRGIGAKLLVSCRQRISNQSGRLTLVRNWIGGEYPESWIGRVGMVEVTDFDLTELAEAAKLLGGDPEARLLDSSLLAIFEHSKT